MNDPALIVNKKLICEKASRLIAISESTKKDIINLYGVSPERVDVVHLGVNAQPKSEKVKTPEKLLSLVLMTQSKIQEKLSV